MTEKTPGFYMRIIICDEQDRQLVHTEAIKIVTAREFYSERLIPANVANTYKDFAAIMGKASEAVNLLDVLTTFSRSNFKPTTVELPTAIQHWVVVPLQTNLEGAIVASSDDVDK